MRRLVLLASASALLVGAVPPVRFSAVVPRFAAATDQYRRVWQAEGAAMVAAMERVTGLEFPDAPIEVLLSDGRPMTSYDGRTIRLRPGYGPNYLRGTLVHELGHRLSFLLPRTADLDDHRLLDLFLYDVWTDLYGRDFADRMVQIERSFGPPYAADWAWALSMTREERQARLAALRPARR